MNNEPRSLNHHSNESDPVDLDRVSVSNVDSISQEFSRAPLENVPVALSPIQRFEEYLQSRRQRNTEQRKFLIERVFSHHEHFDADQLMEQLPRKGDPNYVSRPTVYRALKEFVDAGLLRSFELNGRSVYEHDYGYPQHDHLYCVKCNQLFEFQSDEISKAIEKIAKQYRFRQRGHRLTVNGICDACSKKRSRERRHQDRV